MNGRIFHGYFMRKASETLNSSTESIQNESETSQWKIRRKRQARSLGPETHFDNPFKIHQLVMSNSPHSTAVVSAGGNR